jgi:hypothetical protein
MARRALIGFDANSLDISLSRQDYRVQSLGTVQLLDNVSKKYNINVIHISEFLLNTSKSKYLGVEDGEILYRDETHLSQSGADKVVRSIAHKILGSSAR